MPSKHKAETRLFASRLCWVYVEVSASLNAVALMPDADAQKHERHPTCNRVALVISVTVV